MKRCGHCNQIFDNDKQYCSQCGAPLSQCPAPPEKLPVAYCGKCGKRIEGAVLACPSCGASMGENKSIDDLDEIKEHRKKVGKWWRKIRFVLYFIWYAFLAVMLFSGIGFVPFLFLLFCGSMIGPILGKIDP